MPTLTIRNLPPRLARTLKALASRHDRSLEQEACAIIEESAGDRLSALGQIESGWADQSRRPEPGEIDDWMQTGPV